ncbi:MAG: restriction endonuclease [Bacteroidota bacterium]|nr:restriction endonuclease [Bacteroidota bacterium]
MLVQVYPPSQGLERAVTGKLWKASPATRMMELLHGSGVVLGLVTNGGQWMLVYAPAGESTGFISWQSSLLMEEPLTFRAFTALLGASRLFGVPDDESLEAMLRKSAERQKEVTEQLGMQVRASVEMLVQAIDRLDAERGRVLLAGISEARLYEAAVTVMMRLVFLLSAEERGLLLLGTSELYDSHYAASTLAAQLRETADRHGEELLERRHDAWSRLLALFRAVYGGLRHEDLHLPAYGGALFDPDRFPFLEGRTRATSWRDTGADPLALDNRTVLHMLESLQFLVERDLRGGVAEPRRLSFRALDIEQIGHVYESLLDHTVWRAPSDRPVLGLVGDKGNEPEVDIHAIETAANGWRPGSDAPPDRLMEFLKNETAKTPKALGKLLETEIDALREARLRAACGQDETLIDRILPWAGLIRDDSYDRPVLIPAGSAYVTQGSDRRQTGAHYTPRSLTAEVVKHTLDPLVYDGPAEGRPKEKWKLREPDVLLALRVCDPAVGSAAFLVQACRELSERLVESWEVHGGPADLPADTEDRLQHARRLVAERCLYGVDRNPLAVEMARLSLWLVTMAREKPFTFLDHAIKCGDSLLGFATAEQLVMMHPAPGPGQQIGAWIETVSAAVNDAVQIRRQIESFPVAGLADAQRKRDMLADAEQAIAQSKRLCDAVIAAAVHTADGGAKKRGGKPHPKFGDLRSGILSAFDDTEAFDRVCTKLGVLLEENNPSADARRPFHWPLEYPEVFVNGGFDAIVSNPPFLGGKKLTGPLGTDYRFYLQDYLAEGAKGNADLAAFFFLRAGTLLKSAGNLGMLATNTIAQGDTREVGLDQMTAGRGLSIYRAVKSRKWPGEANLEIAQLWLHKGEWKGEYDLDGGLVKCISPYLSIPGKIEGPPKRLKENMGKSFQGSIVLGKGFILEIDEAKRLLDKDPRNNDVLFPYLTGQDLNSRPDQSPSRWVINFHDWPLERAMEYPDVLRIVEEKVKPERQRKKPDGSYALRKPLPQRWWQYADKRPALYKAIEGMERVLVTTRVTKHVWFSMVQNTCVFADRVIVFRDDVLDQLPILQSSIFDYWAREYSSTLETRLNFSHQNCYETFPFKDTGEDEMRQVLSLMNAVHSVGTRYNQGVTDVLNVVNDPKAVEPEIVWIREQKRNLDMRIARCYIPSLSVKVGFFETKGGVQYTISPDSYQIVSQEIKYLNSSRERSIR